MSGIKQLAGKVAVVTGGASGIGKGIAGRLLAHGMKVVIADIEQATLDKTAAEIGATGILTDVSSFECVEALAGEVRRRFGAVHLVCNNAGVGSTAKIADMALTDWTWLLGVNLWGVIHGIKAFLPLLKANPDGGHLVNTASMAGFHITPGLGGYTVSKFAVAALSETLAAELAADGSKIGVTVLCPGPVKSNLGSSQRNRPRALGGGAFIDSNVEATEEGARLRWIDPDRVGEILVRAVMRGDLYAFTHPEWAPIVQERHSKIAQAFADAAIAH